MKTLTLAAALSLAAMPAFAQTAAKPTDDPHAGHMMMDMSQQAAPAAAKPDNPAIPPADAASADRLKASPRHGEWVDIKMPSGPALKSFVVYPERKDKAPVVLVIHDIFGMGDWARAAGDRSPRKATSRSCRTCCQARARTAAAVRSSVRASVRRSGR